MIFLKSYEKHKQQRFKPSQSSSRVEICKYIHYHSHNHVSYVLTYSLCNEVEHIPHAKLSSVSLKKCFCHAIISQSMRCGTGFFSLKNLEQEEVNSQVVLGNIILVLIINDISKQYYYPFPQQRFKNSKYISNRRNNDSPKLSMRLIIQYRFFLISSFSCWHPAFSFLQCLKHLFQPNPSGE